MIKNNTKNKLFGGLLALSYIFSLCFVLLHDHSHDHRHDHSHDHSKVEVVSFCQDNNFSTSLDIKCSHESHLEASEKTCFICDNCIIVDHISFNSTLNSINFNLLKNYNEFLQKIIVKDVTNYLNKSPPSLI